MITSKVSEWILLRQEGSDFTLLDITSVYIASYIIYVVGYAQCRQPGSDLMTLSWLKVSVITSKVSEGVLQRQEGSDFTLSDITSISIYCTVYGPGHAEIFVKTTIGRQSQGLLRHFSNQMPLSVNNLHLQQQALMYKYTQLTRQTLMWSCEVYTLCS